MQVVIRLNYLETTKMSFSLVLFHNPHYATKPKSHNTIFTISSSYKPRKSSSSSTNRIFTTNQPKLTPQIQTLAARDTIIDFGKHKGKRLGTLPSTYLKWVSKNLRAGDTEYWANLADEVLKDDVYKDKIEWEFAEEILHGSNDTIKVINREDVNSVSLLLEVSERFGWDNEDKIGWSRINFELLGTSKGGRIPRLSNKTNQEEMVRRREETKKKKEEEEDGNGWRRRQRRERMRQSLGDDGKGVNRSEHKGVLGKLEDVEKKIEPKIHSPFPGRESLLKKVMYKKKIQ